MPVTPETDPTYITHERARLMISVGTPSFTRFVQDIVAEADRLQDAMPPPEEEEPRPSLYTFSVCIGRIIGKENFWLDNDTEQYIPSLARLIQNLRHPQVQEDARSLVTYGVLDSMHFATVATCKSAESVSELIIRRGHQTSPVETLRSSSFKRLMNELALAPFAMYGDRIDLVRYLTGMLYGDNEDLRRQGAGYIIDIDENEDYQLKPAVRTLLTERMRDQNAGWNTISMAALKTKNRRISTAGCPVARRPKGEKSEPTGIDIWCDFLANQYEIYLRRPRIKAGAD